MRAHGWVSLFGAVGVAVAVLVAGGGVAALTIPSTAVAAESRDRVRLDLLDACVYDLWKKREEKDHVAHDCKCAAKAAAKKLSEAQVSAFKGKLSRNVMPLWREAAEACFTS